MEWQYEFLWAVREVITKELDGTGFSPLPLEKQIVEVVIYID